MYETKSFSKLAQLTSLTPLPYYVRIVNSLYKLLIIVLSKLHTNFCKESNNINVITNLLSLGVLIGFPNVHSNCEDRIRIYLIHLLYLLFISYWQLCIHSSLLFLLSCEWYIYFCPRSQVQALNFKLFNSISITSYRGCSLIQAKA